MKHLADQPPVVAPPPVRAVGRSHPGWVRDHNEDALVCEPELGLFAVIDGMGGENAGEVAAATAASQLLRSGPGPEGLVAAVQAANEQILREGTTDAGKHGMGCVLTAVSLREDRLFWVHVGDTRAYLASAVGCERITRDHTSVAELQEAMGLSEVEARNLPGQHQVTRDLGRALHDDDSWIDRGEAEFQEGDLLVLCSDGLSDLVPDAELRRLLATARRLADAPEAVAQTLEKLALDRGGLDNVTVVAVRRPVEGERSGDPDTLPPRPFPEGDVPDEPETTAETETTEVVEAAKPAHTPAATVAGGGLFGRIGRLFRRRG